MATPGEVDARPGPQPGLCGHGRRRAQDPWHVWRPRRCVGFRAASNGRPVTGYLAVSIYRFATVSPEPSNTTRPASIRTAREQKDDTIRGSWLTRITV